MKTKKQIREKLKNLITAFDAIIKPDDEWNINDWYILGMIEILDWALDDEEGSDDQKGIL